MSRMNAETRAREAEHQARIINYYEIAQRYYKLAWCGNTYGLHYGIWADGVRTRHQAITKENEVLADLAGIKEGDRVLDAGCGIGGSGIWLAKNRGATVVGLNIVQKQLTEGEDLVRKKGLSAKVTFELGDYQNIPLLDESFDVYWSCESIEHATDVKTAISEAFRILKPGGRLVMAATFLGRKNISEKERRQMKVGQDVSGCFNDFHTAEYVTDAMRNSGFTNIENTDMTDKVMKSSREMTRMCRLGLPPAKILAAIYLMPRVLVLNNQWGTYQEKLFRDRATSYNVLLATKPK